MLARISKEPQWASIKTSLPTLHQLQILVAIGRFGSFTKAARALHLTESAVSQQVKLLERTVQATLIERDPRPTRVTDAGRRLIATSETMIESLLTVLRDIRQPDQDG